MKEREREGRKGEPHIIIFYFLSAWKIRKTVRRPLIMILEGGRMKNFGPWGNYITWMLRNPIDFTEL